jgi:hypothetical protein
MSQNGKGDADSRVKDRAAFRRSHVRTYGSHEKVDGRRTLLRVGADGTFYDPREKVETFIAIDPAAMESNKKINAHIDRLKNRMVERMMTT